MDDKEATKAMGEILGHKPRHTVLDFQAK